MKRNFYGIFIPANIWTTPDLTWPEKAVLMELYSYCTDGKVSIGAQTLSTALNIPLKEVKDIMSSLFDKGAIEIEVDDTGTTTITPYIYKEHFLRVGDRPKLGSKPRDVETIPYDEIQRRWTEICPMMHEITRFTPQRKQKLKSCLRQADMTVEDLYKVFRIITATPFLNGSTGQFRAEFQWLISKSNNMQKIFEGYYSRSIGERRDYDLIMAGGNPFKAKNTDETVYK